MSISTDPRLQVQEARAWVATDSPESLTPRMRNLLTWMADSIDRAEASGGLTPDALRAVLREVLDDVRHDVVDQEYGVGYLNVDALTDVLWDRILNALPLDPPEPNTVGLDSAKIVMRNPA